MKKVIYYFTGTGNSMRAAEKIAICIGNTEIISMRNDPKDFPATDADIIGFIYPVYHWTMPLPVAQFVKELSLNPTAYIFVVTMPSFINGYACEKLEELLLVKGAKIAYGAKVHSVANYVINYSPRPSPKWVVPRTEKRIDKIASDVADMKTKGIPKAGFVVRKRYLKLMPKYHELMPLYDYGFIINECCKSCGLCSKLCPCNNIVVIDGKPVFCHNCSHCMACVCYCPKRAIGYKTPDSVMELLDSNLLNNVFVKKMGLPPKRKIYHNPYVTAADIVVNKKQFD